MENQAEYWLPKHSELVEEKSKLIAEFEKKIEESQNSIDQNLKKFSFLHEMISETGNSLTEAIIKFLKWLEFKKVEAFDEKNTKSTLLEEDIQVTLPNGVTCD